MAKFEDHIAALIEREGGARVVNDPDDPGGLTKYGISKRANPGEDIESLTLSDATRIYREKYWRPIKGDDMPEALAAPMLDMAVTSGPYWASVILQRVIGADADGMIGPKTLAALRGATGGEEEYSGTRDSAEKLVAALYGLKRIEMYTEIAHEQGRPLSHLVSWTRRALALSPREL